MNKATRGRNVDTIFVLIIFSVFAFSVLMVLMLGASVYRNVNDISREGQQEHTALSYIWTKTKNYDSAGSIYAGEFHGLSALFIDEHIGGSTFRTAIYNYDGWLLELYGETLHEFSPRDGVRIVQNDSLIFRESGNGLIEVTAGSLSFLLHPRSGLSFSAARVEVI